MAWNRSIPQQVKPKKKISRFLPYISILGVVILVISFFIMSASEDVVLEEKEASSAQKTPKKKPVKPDIPKESLESDSTVVETNTVEEATPTVKKAKHSGRFVDVSKAIFIPRKDPPRRFINDAEEDVASLLEVIPGEMIVGEINYHKKNRFVNSLKQALENPTRIDENDSAYSVELKNSVRDVINDLAQRMRKGEDVAATMKQARSELQDLGIFRMELQNELKNIRKTTDVSTTEYEEFVAAANKMLIEKGAEPLKIPKIVYHQLKLREERKEK